MATPSTPLRSEAQQRADEIAIFRAELARLEVEGVLVTATTRFIAEVFAQQFGLHDLIATESARDTAGHLTGEVIGEPCWGPHKIAHVQAWLARQSAPRLAMYGSIAMPTVARSGM